MRISLRKAQRDRKTPERGEQKKKEKKRREERGGHIFFIPLKKKKREGQKMGAVSRLCGSFLLLSLFPLTLASGSLSLSLALSFSIWL